MGASTSGRTQPSDAGGRHEQASFVSVRHPLTNFHPHECSATASFSPTPAQTQGHSSTRTLPTKTSSWELTHPLALPHNHFASRSSSTPWKDDSLQRMGAPPSDGFVVNPRGARASWVPQDGGEVVGSANSASMPYTPALDDSVVYRSHNTRSAAAGIASAYAGDVAGGRRFAEPTPRTVSAVEGEDELVPDAVDMDLDSNAIAASSTPQKEQTLCVV